ncbi:uncharacterized protein LOC128198718 [Bicyclus anynana]|uniref:Uncharacterized protein LOC128198718 n=1 Tax=Bicyclus anynana TaxID=110368 RepID=A0ABM3LQG9_BICAN|nr:uncharacterized protein LOC128198718 [Bicyclus anynana]
MTAYNIRRLMRGTAVLNSAAAGNPAAHQQQRNRLTVYLKLSIIMGVNWLLEVISAELKNDLLAPVYIITDIYNLFMGVAIFLIFVCKRKIYQKLKIRFYTLRGNYLNRRPTTQDSSSQSKISNPNSGKLSRVSSSLKLRNNTNEIVGTEQDS